MSFLVMKQNSARWIIATLMTLLLVLTYWLYQQGFSAGFQFDDGPSISGVSGVRDISSALAYMFDGRAGLIGRPLALATFLLQKDSWPNDPAVFFQVNTLIHLFNGVLVYWFSYRLTQFFPEKIRQPAWFSLAVMTLWLTLPLHVSASLMAVQRMATLSSTFMLLGLIGYVSGRAMLNQSPTRAYWQMTASVVVGTLLALLCKESGALLLLYVLVLEVALVRAAGAPTDIKFKRWVWVFLGAPVFLMAAYFVYNWPSMMSAYALRSFTVSERLLTEARVLWDYLGQIYFPVRDGTGPYHDDYPISRGLFNPGVTAIAILAWVLALSAALWFRKRAPLFLFALLWFLAGHLIESSFIPLELYFEHRNYLASLGPLLLACVLIWHVPVKVLRVSMAGLLLMILLRLFVLGEATSLWGQNLLSAKVWSDEHPQSARAAQFLSMAYFHAGNQDAMRKTTLDGHARIKNDILLALDSLYMSCQHDVRPAFLSRIKDIEPVLSGGIGGASVPALLNKLLDSQQKGECPNLSLHDLHGFANALQNNSHNQAAPGILAALHIFKYRLYALEGKPNLSIRELLTAFSLKNELVIAVMAARAMANADHSDDAIAFLNRAMTFAPRNPLLKHHWEMEFEKVKLSIVHPQVTLPGKKLQ